MRDIGVCTQKWINCWPSTSTPATRLGLDGAHIPSHPGAPTLDVRLLPLRNPEHHFAWRSAAPRPTHPVAFGDEDVHDLAQLPQLVNPDSGHLQLMHSA